MYIHSQEIVHEYVLRFTEVRSLLYEKTLSFDEMITRLQENQESLERISLDLQGATNEERSLIELAMRDLRYRFIRIHNSNKEDWTELQMIDDTLCKLLTIIIKKVE